ncbi:carbon-nitrogen hydrolase family protein [Sphingobium sp. CAP-1]|uniref:carbon-nitrogen hydrolase family protein n=1 Tax=Sphingobium sp. CAP-1 TaxID=2676077 RepID=UPI0012BB235B|nr:carbon-nitrogen hydrolase family protein [Sphingobium sp. CAP-1]QGP80922.1 amidohydrolase [Sphingobium sp. CAP-1]
MTDFRVAAAQYPIELLPSFGAWEAKISRWVSEAAEQGAQLLMFPEYAAMELAGSDPDAAADLQASLHHVMALGERIDDWHRQLAIHYEVTILGGSRPCRDDRGLIVNRARLFCPDGRSDYQDKIVMTRFEREIWGIAGGEAIHAIDTPVGRVGISICYDAEFPLIARAQAEAGVCIILVPSATDNMQGYWRVRIGAQARALENQCYVVQASTVGEAPWLPSLDDNHGAAAIYGPPDGITPDNGVFAVGELNRPQWLFADIGPAEVDRWRQEGTVLPFRHWPEQRVPVRTIPGDPEQTTRLPAIDDGAWLGSSRPLL